MVKPVAIVATVIAAVGVITSVFAPKGTGLSPSAYTRISAAHAISNVKLHAQLLPTADTFIPIAVWDQAPNGGNVPSAYKDQAAAFHAMGINVFVGMNSWPERFGSDDGELEAAVAEHMYVIGGGDPLSDTSAESVASVTQLVSKIPLASKYFIGYQWGDEPTCATDVAAQVATIEREDPTRLLFDNEGAWIAWLPQHNVLGSATCLAESEGNLRATSIASADDYAITDPWHTYLCTSDGRHDCLWVYGREAQNMRALVGSDKPVWEFIESGTDDLGLSSQGGPCNWTTNLCRSGNEAAATPVQVNSAVWDALINGASGIEWFCDERLPNGLPIWDYCASNGTIRSNLTFIDHTVDHFAPEINAPPVLGGLSVRSSNRAVPIVSVQKQVKVSTYLFVESDRDGATMGNYRLSRFANGTALLLYDSNTRYDPSVSEQGETFKLNSKGSFADSLPGNYSVKIYEIFPSAVNLNRPVPDDRPVP